MSTGPAPDSPPPLGVSKRFAELQAGRLATAPLDPVELAVAAETIALATLWLAVEAASTRHALPADALAGAQALRQWAKTTAAEQPTQPAPTPPPPPPRPGASRP